MTVPVARAILFSVGNTLCAKSPSKICFGARVAAWLEETLYVGKKFLSVTET